MNEKILNKTQAQIGAAYKNVFNSEDGQVVIEHMKEVARYAYPFMDVKMPDKEIQAWHWQRTYINWIMYMRDTDFTKPEQKTQVPIEEHQNEY